MAVPRSVSSQNESEFLAVRRRSRWLLSLGFDDTIRWSSVDDVDYGGHVWSALPFQVTFAANQGEVRFPESYAPWFRDLVYESEEDGAETVPALLYAAFGEEPDGGFGDGDVDLLLSGEMGAVSWSDGGVQVEVLPGRLVSLPIGSIDEAHGFRSLPSSTGLILKTNNGIIEILPNEET